jgi:hypothetical protein
MSDHDDEDGIEDDDADFDFDLDLDTELGVDVEVVSVHEAEAVEAEVDIDPVFDEDEGGLIVALEEGSELFDVSDEMDEEEVVVPAPAPASVILGEDVEFDDVLFFDEPEPKEEDKIVEEEVIVASKPLKKEPKKAKAKRLDESALEVISKKAVELEPLDEPFLDEPKWDDDWGSKKTRAKLPGERGGPPSRNQQRSRATKSSKPGAFGGWDIKGLRQNKMLYVALGITGVVIVTLLFIFKKDDDENGGKSSGGGETATSAKVVLIDQTEAMNAVPVNVSQDEMLEYLNKYATETAKAFFAAESVEGILATSREPEKIRAKVTEYYRRKPFRPSVIEKVVLDEVTMIDDHTLLVGKAVKTNGRAALVVMEKTSKGLLMEWEYQVAYDPMAWDAFVTDRPEGAMDFRVMCTAATDYVAPFTKEADYFAMEITSKSGDSKVLGYISRDSEKGRELNRIVQNEFEVPVILTLRFPSKQESSAHNAVYIDDLVADGWIIAY